LTLPRGDFALAEDDLVERLDAALKDNGGSINILLMGDDDDVSAVFVAMLSVIVDSFTVSMKLTVGSEGI
jgi:hypothetical protein